MIINKANFIPTFFAGFITYEGCILENDNSFVSLEVMDTFSKSQRQMKALSILYNRYVMLVLVVSLIFSSKSQLKKVS